MIRHRRAIKFTLLLAAMAMLGGCFGTFSLTRSVYHSNRNVYSSVPGDNTQRKMAQSAVMWLFIPLYAVAGVADAVVFNVIEFWTGNRTEVGSVPGPDGTAVSLAPSNDGREAILTVSRGGQMMHQERLVKVSDNLLEIRDMSGQLKGTMVRGEAGQFEVRDPGGQTLQRFAASF